MPKSRGRGFDRAPKKGHIIAHKLAMSHFVKIFPASNTSTYKVALCIEKLTSNIKN